MFFVDGSSASRIEGDLIGHVKLALPGSPQIGFKDAMSFFQNPKNSKWLIAFDNVDDIDLDFRPFIPECNQGTVVITSRNHSLGQLASPPHLHLKLDVMSKDEAVGVILQCAGTPSPSDEEREAVAVIAYKLGYLPVALSQAGCYMREATCSANTYIKLLDNHRPQMMDKPSSSRQKDCAYAAFDISYHQLPKALKNVVHLLSFFHFSNFPEGIIPHAAKKSFRLDPILLEQRGPRFEESIQLLHDIFLPNGVWSDLTLTEIARLLQSSSIISVIPMPETNLWRIHPLLREWAFDRLDSRDVFRDAACRLVVRDEKDAHLIAYLPAHIESIMARPVNSPICINDSLAMATTVRVMAQTTVARSMILPIYTSILEKFGPDDLKVATISLELAQTLAASSDTRPEARKLQEDAVRIREALLGSNHIDTIAAKIDLSETLYFLDMLAASERILDEVLEQLDTKSEDTRLQSLYAMHYLSRIHGKQRRFAEAETLQIKVLEGYRTEVGDMHPYTLVAMSDHALICSDQGRYSEAEVLQLKILEAYKLQMGGSHNETLRAMANLGRTYHWQGRYSEAEALQANVLDARRVQLGDSHDATLVAMGNLARTYFRQGRYSEAETLQVKVLDARRVQLGDSHDEPLVAMGNLALTYGGQGRYSEAEALQVKVLDARRVQIGDSHDETLTAMDNLAVTYFRQGRYSEAEPLQAEALRVGTTKNGENSLEVANYANNLAWTYYYMHRIDEAKALVLKAERISRSRHGGVHKSASILLRHLNVPD